MSTSVDTERERAVSQSTGLLNLLIDRTGIKAEGEGEWNARRPEVRAVEVTGNNIGDAPMLPELLNQIPSYQDIGSVTTDGRMTPVNATRRLPPETPMQCSRHARMQSPVNQRVPEQLLVTMQAWTCRSLMPLL